MQSVAVDQLYQDFEDDPTWADAAGDEPATGPVLPTILLNAALALTTAGGTFALARFLLDGTLLTSMVIAILVLLIAFTPLGILAARLTGTPVLVGNLGWGCGVLVMTLLFFGLCGLSGAVAALLVRAAGLGTQ
jgi:hypothetical protein